MKTAPSLRALVVATALLAPIAHAQPDANNAPKADNPQNRPAGNGNGKRPNRPQMTPEERQAQMEKYLKSQLERVGVTDDAQQTAVTDYIKGETEARNKLGESGQALATALRTDAVTDTQVAALLNTYNANIEDDKIRRVAAQKALNEKIDLLKFPRLEAFLTVMGYYGDGTGFGGATGGFGRLPRGANPMIGRKF